MAAPLIQNIGGKEQKSTCEISVLQNHKGKKRKGGRRRYNGVTYKTLNPNRNKVTITRGDEASRSGSLRLEAAEPLSTIIENFQGSLLSLDHGENASFVQASTLAMYSNGQSSFQIQLEGCDTEDVLYDYQPSAESVIMDSCLSGSGTRGPYSYFDPSSLLKMRGLVGNSNSASANNAGGSNKNLSILSDFGRESEAINANLASNKWLNVCKNPLSPNQLHRTNEGLPIKPDLSTSSSLSDVRDNSSLNIIATSQSEDKGTGVSALTAAAAELEVDVADEDIPGVVITCCALGSMSRRSRRHSFDWEMLDSVVLTDDTGEEESATVVRDDEELGFVVVG